MMVAIDTDSSNARLSPPCEEALPGLLIGKAGFARQTDPEVAADMGPRPGLGA